MPESIDWPRMHPPRRRRRFFLLIAAVIAGIFFGGRAALSYYVDVLWFESLGYRDVFWKTLGLQWGIFTAFAAATFLILYGSFLALKRAHLRDLPTGHTILIGGQPLKLPVEPVLRLVALGLALVIAVGPGIWQAAELLSLHPACLPTSPRLGTYAGRDDLCARCLFRSHYGQNSCGRRADQDLCCIALAWALQHVCGPGSGPCDACVPRSIRAIVR